jgi:predicted MFS family arabinose efflux permease
MLAIQLALFGWLQRHVRRESLMVGSFLTMAVGFALLAGTSVYGVVAVLVALIALGTGVLLPMLSLATTERAGAEVATAVGYQNAASNLGQAGGSAAIGLLFSAVPGVSFGVVAAVMLATALIGWYIARGGGLLGVAPPVTAR